MNTRTPKFGSVDNLRKFVADSSSIAEVARKCGYKDAGGTVAFLKKIIKLNKISTEHFSGSSWSKGKSAIDNPSLRRHFASWDELFRNGSKASSKTLMTRLIESGKKVYACDKCDQSSWLGQPLRIQLEHKNGNSIDNRVENLMFLCPNCHSQTETYCRGEKAVCKDYTEWWKELSRRRG
jgi:Zn finger protein HypA/HybF involved in hydrogenase expression